MKFLPKEHFSYKTSLSSAEVLAKIAEHTEPRKTRITRGYRHELASGIHKKYQGEIVGNSFTLSRLINYRNSFLPTISGEVKEDLDGTTIQVQVHMVRLVQIFMAIWLGIVGFGFIVLLWHLINHAESVFILLIPLGMFLFGYAIMTGGFKYESKKVRRDFDRWFGAG